MHRKLSWIFSMTFLMMCLSACTLEETEAISLEEAEANQEETIEESESIFVYVCGAVVQEGVYEFPNGSRVYEAIEKAGGFSEHAAITTINQAEVLEDEMQLYVPTIEEMLDAQEVDDGKINLNTASKEDLMRLPGIGESKAESIIEYRELNGKFQAVEDVMEIPGIKEGLFNKMKNYIKI